MAIKRPDIYEHNNPNNAISDSDFVRGGIRSKVPNLPALGALTSKADQLKEYATFVWVESENKYYVLVDKNNIGNINGWSSTILGSNGSGEGGEVLPSVMIFRDSLETYAQLEAISNPRQGDVYSVYNDPNPDKNARLYVRIENYGGELGKDIWKDLGVSVDLRDYVTSGNLMSTLAGYVTNQDFSNTLNNYIPTSHPANTVTNNNIASWNNKVDKPSAPNNVNTKVILADGTTKNISEITGMTSVTTDSTLQGDGTSGNPLGLSDSKNAEIAGKISKQGTDLWNTGDVPNMRTGSSSGIYRAHGASNPITDWAPFLQMTVGDSYGQISLDPNSGALSYRAGVQNNPYSATRTAWDTGNLPNPATQTWVNQQKGIANGLATLNDYGVVPPSQLPSYLDEGLKSVKAGKGIIVNNSDYRNPIISVDSELSNVLTKEFTVTSGAGSFSPGDSFPGNLTLAEAFKALLTDVFEPTFPVSVGYSLSNNGMSGNTPLWEVGSSQNLRLTSSFNRGQIKGNYRDGEWFPDEINPRAGLPSSHIIDGTTYTTTDTVQVKNIPIVVPATSTTYYSTVNYGAGMQPKNSQGKDSDLPYSGGNMSASTSVVGGLKTYAGPINSLPTTGSQIRTALLNTSVLNRPNKFDYTMSTTTPFYVIATPVGRVLDSVITANNENQTSLFKKSSSILTVPDAAGTNRDYNVYIADLGDPFTSAITVTINLKNG